MTQQKHSIKADERKISQPFMSFLGIKSPVAVIIFYLFGELI
jgi:hypothetical protein